ncbi:MAG: type II toxin-antitoxin system VapB family antitoxin [Spirochaetia bacterium]|nr:type II toxin-antitoxin system VapB family antitoxin [Spirochaetia bacterium]
MKTTINIPVDILNEMLEYSQSKTKTEAILTAVKEYIQKRKMAKLAARLGSMENLISRAELMTTRKEH